MTEKGEMIMWGTAMEGNPVNLAHVNDGPFSRITPTKDLIPLPRITSTQEPFPFSGITSTKRPFTFVWVC